MSYKEHEYADISDLLLEREKNSPMNMGRYEGRIPSPCDPTNVGDTVEVKTSKEKLRITVEVESVCSKSIHGRIDNVHGNERQDLPLDAKVEIFNEYILCVFRKNETDY